MRRYIEWTHSIAESYSQLTTTLEHYLPNLIGALLLIIFGWVCATLARFLILKLARAIDRLVIALGKQLGFKRIGSHKSVTVIIANTVFWLIILFFLGSILRALGWPGLLILLHDYFPLLLSSVFIVLFGFMIGHLLAYFISNYDGIKEVKYADTLAKITKLIVCSFAVLMAFEYLGFDMMLFEILFLLIISFFLLGVALAFGFGARHAVSHLLAMRNVRRYYQIGQYVNIDGVQGQVIDIQSHAIVLQTEKGRAIVPGNIFYEKIAFFVEHRNDK